MRAPESLIPVLEQLCTVLEQLCRVEADKLTVVSADHPDQLESLLNDENMLLLQLRGLDKNEVIFFASRVLRALLSARF